MREEALPIAPLQPLRPTIRVSALDDHEVGRDEAHAQSSYGIAPLHHYGAVVLGHAFEKRLKRRAHDPRYRQRRSVPGRRRRRAATRRAHLLRTERHRGRRAVEPEHIVRRDQPHRPGKCVALEGIGEGRRLRRGSGRVPTGRQRAVRPGTCRNSSRSTNPRARASAKPSTATMFADRRRTSGLCDVRPATRPGSQSRAGSRNRTKVVAGKGAVR